MNSTGTGVGLAALWGVHVLSVILFFVGVILLILWAAKTLNQDQLKTWGITLAVIGTIACLLTIGMRGAPWGDVGMMSNSETKMMYMQMMEKMMGGMMDQNDSGTTHHMGGDAMSMSMDDMSAMLKGKTGDAFDKAFIEGMIPHHQGAIEMARAAEQSAKHQEIKDMAEDIIATQKSEIDIMRSWQQSWGYAE